MPESIAVLCLGCDHRVLWSLPYNHCTGFIVIIVPTTEDASRHIQGPDDIRGILVEASDSESLQRIITFVAAIKRFFHDPIIAVGANDGIERVS